MYWDHPIAEAIGLDDAQRLSSYAGGGDLFVPSCHPGLLEKRKLQIKALIEASEPRRTIALRMGIGMRQLRRIIHKMGMSGVSTARRASKALPAPPQSVFNGGIRLFCCP